MAYIFMMALHCATESSARGIANRYSGQTFVFTDPRYVWSEDVCRFSTDVREAEEEWWTEITPSGITVSGISSHLEAERATQFCNVMYGMLRNERFFDYGMAGVECSEFRTRTELCDALAVGSVRRLDGLVVSKELLGAFSNAKYFVEFSGTHSWIPKTAVRYPRNQR